MKSTTTSTRKRSDGAPSAPRIIRNQRDLERATARIEALFDCAEGTAAHDELELLVMLVEAYEEKAFPVGLPDPISAIRFRMDQRGLSPRDLVPLLGSRSRVSEVLAGKRTLSLSMIRALHGGLNIPYDVLLAAPSHSPRPRARERACAPGRPGRRQRG